MEINDDRSQSQVLSPAVRPSRACARCGRKGGDSCEGNKSAGDYAAAFNLVTLMTPPGQGDKLLGLKFNPLLNDDFRGVCLRRTGSSPFGVPGQ